MIARPVLRAAKFKQLAMTLYLRLSVDLARRTRRFAFVSRTFNYVVVFVKLDHAAARTRNRISVSSRQRGLDAMLHYLFQGIQAYNQVGFFIGAVVLLGLGGVVLANCLYWRVHSIRVEGAIIGVMDGGGTYTPVYQYVAPNGHTYKAKSDTSSGSTLDKQTGRRVSLLISAHNPGLAREANSFLLEVVGLLLVAPGMSFGYFAVTAYPVTWMTWMMAAAMILYLGERAYRVLIPKGKRISVAEWRQERGLDAPPDFSEVKPIEQIVSSQQEQEKLKLQNINNRRAAPIVAIFAAALFGVGIYQARHVVQLAASGIRSEGEVIRLVSQSGSGGHVSYYPIVRFLTNQNAVIEFKGDIGSNPPIHRPGDRVAVLYLATDPYGSAAIDHGTFLNWTIPALIIGSGVFLVWLLLSMLRSINKRALAVSS